MEVLKEEENDETRGIISLSMGKRGKGIAYLGV